MFYIDVGEMVDYSIQIFCDENSNKLKELDELDVDGEKIVVFVDSGFGENK